MRNRQILSIRDYYARVPLLQRCCTDVILIIEYLCRKRCGEKLYMKLSVNPT